MGEEESVSPLQGLELLGDHLVESHPHETAGKGDLGQTAYERAINQSKTTTKSTT